MDYTAINQAEQLVDEQKKAGAGRLDEMAKAVHGAADELNGQMPQAAELVHAAASRLQQGADALRDQRVQDLVSGFNDFGRKEPLTLFGSAVIAGLAISRLLKGSAQYSR